MIRVPMPNSNCSCLLRISPVIFKRELSSALCVSASGASKGGTERRRACSIGASVQAADHPHDPISGHSHYPSIAGAGKRYLFSIVKSVMRKA